MSAPLNSLRSSFQTVLVTVVAVTKSSYAAVFGINQAFNFEVATPML